MASITCLRRLSLTTWTDTTALQFVFSGNADLRMMDPSATTPWCTYLAILAIYSYGTLLDGACDFSDLPFVFSEGTEVRIEPRLARRNALLYLERLLSARSAEELPQVHDKHLCGGVIAYGVHQLGAIDWGVRKHCNLFQS